jgi:flagellar motor switch/type III secretory pathway protein FliN
MPADVQALLRLEVPLIVELGTRMMTLDEVSSLVPGAIIELPTAAEDDLSIRIRNKQIGAGRALKVGENFGIRISDLEPRRDRLEGVNAED